MTFINFKKVQILFKKLFFFFLTMLIQDKLKKNKQSLEHYFYIKFKIQAANNRIVDFRYNKHKANIKLSIVTNARHMWILHKFLFKGRHICSISKYSSIRGWNKIKQNTAISLRTLSEHTDENETKKRKRHTLRLIVFL